MPRAWPIVTRHLADSGPIKHGLELVCGLCGAREFQVVSNGRVADPASYAANLFTLRKWAVGRRPEDDRCPACAAMERRERRARKATPKKGNSMTKAIPSAPAAEEPRQMDFTDRRIIFAKLEMVYLDRETGYDAGWSDKRVSDELKIPRAWVAQMREENFGPAKDNEDIRDLLKRVAAAESSAAEIGKRAVALESDARKLLGDVASLAKTAEIIRKAVA